jgi:hypothetical protein
MQGRHDVAGFAGDERGGAVQGIATAPEFIWELSIGRYLTFKGFKSTARVLSPESQTHGVAPAYAAA